MQKKLLKLIEVEDKKNPLTDEQLAQNLIISRSEATLLRQSAGLPDSRERRKFLLIEEIKDIINCNKNISERNLTEELNKRGARVSRYTVSKLLKDMDLPQQYNASDDIDKSANFVDPFSLIIGWNKSLRVQIEQAKAAVLYPPDGLHTLIVGPTGVGKSELAEAMYKFALYNRNLDSTTFPFVVFNCADYAENPQLLLAQLFGYRKGAFTGAQEDKDGLIAKADGGILFLDEVHRLPPDGQEILFQLMDKGKYRKLGETAITRDAKVMLITATTENIETNLLGAFRRRIPMLIELPSLSKRPLEEKLEIAKMFFYKEAVRINKTIVVNHNVFRTLLLYDCIGNIGQLKSDIQVACARAFLLYVAGRGPKEKDHMMVDIENLPIHIAKQMLNIKADRNHVEKYTYEDMVFSPNKDETREGTRELLFPDDIYKNIEEDYQKLHSQGLPMEVIDKIIGDNLESKVMQMISRMKKNKQKLIKNDLIGIVDTKIIQLVHEMVKIAKSNLIQVDDTLFYCLAIHLNASVDRIKAGKYIKNLKLDELKKQYPGEFKIATEMLSFSNYYLGFSFPEDEIGFIAMYLKALTNNNIANNDLIGIVVITHGHVAEGMVSVVNRLLGVNHVKAVEMSLDENPESAFERALEEVKEADAGKGVLLLVDLGSLSGFGSMITSKTGIVTRTITRVDTVMIVDAMRKVLLPDAEINSVANSLIKEKNTEINHCDDYIYNRDELAVISLCLTGVGTAKYIQKLLLDEFKKFDKKVKVVTVGVLDEKDIMEQIEMVRVSMNVAAIVGTVNPGHPEIPFISFADVLKGNGMTFIMEAIRKKTCSKSIHSNQIRLRSTSSLLFNKDLIFVNKNKIDKNEAIHLMCDNLVRKGYVTDKFVNGVLYREDLGPTALENCIAIPHGYSEEIIYPAISIMTLKHPIAWCDNTEISVIFMLALDENLKHEFTHIYKILSNRELVLNIKKAGRPDDILDLIKNFY